MSVPYQNSIEKKYKALRIIATIYKVLAFVVGGLCVIGGFLIMIVGVGSSASSSSYYGEGVAALFSGVVGGVFLLIYGAVLFIALYGAGEFVYVFLDIEENTRMTSLALTYRA